MTSEPREIRIKRLKMRAMRRGIKEMDLVLSEYGDRHLATMSDPELDLFDALLDEYDQDLMQWITGQAEMPDRYADLLVDISQTFQK